MVRVKYCDNQRKVDLGLCARSCDLMDFVDSKLDELDDLVQCVYYIELENCSTGAKTKLYYLYDELVDIETFKSFLVVFSLV